SGCRRCRSTPSPARSVVSRSSAGSTKQGRAARRPCGNMKGLLGLLRIVDALDQVGVGGAVLGAYRRRRVVERLGVDGDELDAGSLELGRIVGDADVPQRPLLHLRLAREFL